MPIAGSEWGDLNVGCQLIFCAFVGSLLTPFRHCLKPCLKKLKLFTAILMKISLVSNYVFVGRRQQILFKFVGSQLLFLSVCG